MADKKTTDETTRSPIDGTEEVRLATTGANWKAVLTAIADFFATVILKIGAPVTGATASDFLFVDAGGNLGQLGFAVGTVANGGTYTIPTGVWFAALDQSGSAIPAATITLPSSPHNGQIVQVAISDGVAALTVDAPGGATVRGAPDTIGARGGLFSCVYTSDNTQWTCGGGSTYLLLPGVSPVSGATGQILFADNSGTLAATGTLSYNSATGEFFVADLVTGQTFIDLISGDALYLATDTGIKFLKSGGLVGDYNTTNADAWTFAKPVILNDILQTESVAFASLPASPVAGMVATVNDSNTTTWGATIGGSGGNTVLGWYNGSNWTVIGA